MPNLFDPLPRRLAQPSSLSKRAGDDERAGVERASVGTAIRRNPIVNPVLWAKQEVKDQACQSRADTKAFTGRGSLLELRQLLTELDRTTDAMTNLVELTKQVKNAQMYLMLHTKTKTGLTFLRWRERLGDCRHVPWPEAHDRIDAFSPDVGDWYRQATEQALGLNERHKELRRAITTARKVVLRRKPEVYAKPIQ